MSCKASTEDTSKDTPETNPPISFTLDTVPATLPTENVWIITDDTIKRLDLLPLKELLDKAKAEGREIKLEFSNITIIPSLAFRDCTSLTTVSFPKVTTIEGNNVFSGCTSLTTVSLPEVITIEDNYVFEGCTSLTTLSLPKATTIKGNYVFDGCTSLTTVSLPKVTKIGANAFVSCTSLTTMTIATGDTILTLGANAFGFDDTAVDTTKITLTTGNEANKKQFVNEDFEGIIIVE